jgi:agmatine deiminase
MSAPDSQTSDRGNPREVGYFMPAEWEPHEATWLAWPHNRDTWPTRYAEMAEVWTRLVEILTHGEDVHVLAGGEEVMSEARRCTGHLPRVTLHDIATNDAWTRDHGPTFVRHRSGASIAAIDWTYNAWGGKYPPFDRDAVVAQKVANVLGAERFDIDIVMEGGAIETNGAGTVLASEECLLNPNRNPSLTRGGAERQLCDLLAAEQVIWLRGGIVGDDTDGHVDQLARFVDRHTIVTVVEDDPADENHAPLAENLQRLDAARDSRGQPFRIVTLPLPRPVVIAGARLPASYANFYIANKNVIVPTFRDPADEHAIETLATLFPDRDVIGFDAVDLVEGLGGIHCITQQQPAVVVCSETDAN